MRAWRALRPGVAAFSSGSGRGGRPPPRRRAWGASLSPLDRVRRLLSGEEEEAAAPPQVSAEGKAATWVPPEVATAQGRPEDTPQEAEEATCVPRKVATPQVPSEVKVTPCVPHEVATPHTRPEVATPWAFPEVKVAPQARPWIPPEVTTPCAFPKVNVAPQIPSEEAPLEAKGAPQVPPVVATPQACPEKVPPKVKVAPKGFPEVTATPWVPPEKAISQAVPWAPAEVTGVCAGAFCAGELALAEVQRKYKPPVKLLCRLAVGSVLASPGGLLPHHDIIGQVPGQVLRTSARARLLLRRPSLEEYVLLMPRGPTIAYPKDVSAALMMMDVHPGDTVLETGSGSGALSLFLSRAVGPTGRVLSYEVRDDHHNLAKKNYRQWRSSWAIGHREEWPDNVKFILKDILAAAADMKSVMLDAVVLDMLSPQCALPVVQPSLKLGGVCAVYLANITQVIDLLDRVRTCRLPFVCEKIIEVTHRNWMILPAKTKNGKSRQRVETPENSEEPPLMEYEEIPFQDEVVLKESEGNGSLPGNAGTRSSVPYVARPAIWQEVHSAFLTKLRKFRPLPS